MEDFEATLVINPLEDLNKIKALASEPRIQMLDLLRKRTCNINEITAEFGLPETRTTQSDVKAKTAYLRPVIATDAIICFWKTMKIIRHGSSATTDAASRSG